jgi:alkanesulfonate monooxygenase SsuD/methylene tetrahydromethanopterin reductase-like flavin-dependent oxidoreductase (luciferase family)
MTAAPIKLSVLDLVPVFNEVDATFALGQAVELAQTAEMLGFSRYWVAEHHDMPGLASWKEKNSAIIKGSLLFEDSPLLLFGWNAFT